eukprot:1154203-Pelagomonas_calceolata.AAC.14
MVALKWNVLNEAYAHCDIASALGVDARCTIMAQSKVSAKGATKSRPKLVPHPNARSANSVFVNYSAQDKMPAREQAFNHLMPRSRPVMKILGQALLYEQCEMRRTHKGSVAGRPVLTLR